MSGYSYSPVMRSGHVASILPVISAAGGPDAVRTDTIHDEVNAGEEMNEEIAGNAVPIGTIVSPAEQADRLERALGRAAEELIPINSFGGGVGRNGILPSA